MTTYNDGIDAAIKVVNDYIQEVKVIQKENVESDRDPIDIEIFTFVLMACDRIKAGIEVMQKQEVEVTRIHINKCAPVLADLLEALQIGEDARHISVV